MFQKQVIASFLLMFLATLAAELLFAQTFPAKPLRIVTAPAGGGSDFVARQVAEGITGPLGQPVVIDNRPATVVGEAVAKAAPDGYTLLLGSDSLWYGPLLQKAPYDVVRDFAPVTMTTKAPKLLVVHPSLPVRSAKDLIALAKARQGELNYSASGLGSSSHLAAELFISMARINIVRISYAGGQQPLTALLRGEVQLTFTTPPAGNPHIKSGRLRALGVSTLQPSTLVPGVPTIASTGLPGYELIALDGILAPAGTPNAAITRLNQEIVRALNRPDMIQRFVSTGVEPAPSSPEDFAKQIKSDVTKLGQVIREAGIKAE